MYQRVDHFGHFGFTECSCQTRWQRKTLASPPPALTVGGRRGTDQRRAPVGVGIVVTTMAGRSLLTCNGFDKKAITLACHPTLLSSLAIFIVPRLGATMAVPDLNGIRP